MSVLAIAALTRLAIEAEAEATVILAPMDDPGWRSWLRPAVKRKPRKQAAARTGTGETRSGCEA